MAFKPTDQQTRAIVTHDNNVLVTASAGTGKTAVLSVRCVNILSRHTSKPDILNMLVLTFTEAAAEEMRARICRQLRDAYAATRNPHLRTQMLLLQAADIGTIHSFCKKIITEHFYELAIDPTFSIIDSDEQQLIKAEALGKTIDWAWQQPNLTLALSQLLNRRNLSDSGFVSKVVEISDYLNNVISRDTWFSSVDSYLNASDRTSTKIAIEQKKLITRTLRESIARMRHAKIIYVTECAQGPWLQKCEEAYINPLEKILTICDSGNWQACSLSIETWLDSLPRFNKKELGPETADIIKQLIDDTKAVIKGLKDLLILNPEYWQRISSGEIMQTRVMLELVKKFDKLYSAAKREISCLDFSDLEHLALKLLTNGCDENNKFLPSRAAVSLRDKYKYIFVDEYQDINPVQQTILDMLSSGDNVFVVGDVKQSIYAFRGAEPKIFVEKLRPASTDRNLPCSDMRVDLNKNFRSDPAILEFVNHVFKKVMISDIADIDYDKSAWLNSGKDTQKCTGPAVELHLLEKDDLENDVHQSQATIIAKRILEMIGQNGSPAEFEVYDDQLKTYRPVEFRDIVILMRSPAKRVEQYVSVLRNAGIPVTGGSCGYFEATEIIDMLSVLKILDNHQRDIELASVLRSPFFKFTDSELAHIKLEANKALIAGAARSNFYAAIKHYLETQSQTPLGSKLFNAMQTLDQWRTRARQGSIADLIWRIYRQTGFLSFVATLPNGSERQANLLKLHDRAIQFENFVSSGPVASLTRFVAFIEKLQQSQTQWSGEEPLGQAAKAVRIMSVHKSKGLEFPVVFVAELDTSFKKSHGDTQVLIDSDCIGLQITSPRDNSKFDSAAHQVIKQRRRDIELAEEMRILYVALTRPINRLILVAAEKTNKCRDLVIHGSFFDDQPVPDWQLRQCSSHLDWLLLSAAKNNLLHKSLATGMENRCVDSELFTFTKYDNDSISRMSRNSVSTTCNVPNNSCTDSEQTNKIISILTQRLIRPDHSFADAIPAKTSVSTLTHRADEFMRSDSGFAFQKKPKAITDTIVPSSLPASIIGTTYHAIIANLDLSESIDRSAIDITIEKLIGEDKIPAAASKIIDSSAIINFFQSELGNRVLNCRPRLYREWPFTFAIPAAEWPYVGCAALLHTREDMVIDNRSFLDGQIVIVQGIMDLLAQSDDCLIIVDFKTDKCSASQAPQAALKYSAQLDLYARAASAILKTSRLEKWIYMLHPEKAIKLP